MTAATWHQTTTLTVRQVEVLQAIVDCDGSTRDAADRLGLSHKTVKIHLGEMYHHLAVCSLPELIVVGMREQLVTL